MLLNAFRYTMEVLFVGFSVVFGGGVVATTTTTTMIWLMISDTAAFHTV